MQYFVLFLLVFAHVICCSSSCAIFQAFSTALECLAKHYLCASDVLHILNDFLFIATSQGKCDSDLNNFLSLRDRLGVPIAHEKKEGPSTTLQFAGITLDMINMEPCLADDKLQKRNAQLLAMHKCCKTTLKELQSLIGLLNFTCSVVLPGRAFLQRLIDLTKGVCLPHHCIQITEACPHDSQVWLQFLRDFNRRIFFLDEAWQVSPPLILYTNAVGSNGYGALFGKRWFYREWPASWKSLNIAFLELFPITLLLCVWGCQMSKKCVWLTLSISRLQNTP